VNILVVSQYFWPENFRINDLVSELVERGHEVTVLTGQPNYPAGTIYPDFAANPEKYANYCGAKVLRVPLVPRGTGDLRLLLNYVSFAVTGSLYAARKLRRQKFDAIFVCQLSPPTAALPANLLRRLTGTPVVLWVLDLWPESLSAVGATKSKAVLSGVDKLVSFIYRRCDLILVQSRAFIDRIARQAGPVPIEYFPSWAEAVFSGGDAEPAPEVLAKESAFNVMFAGNMGEAQDFPAILDAAERLKEHKHIRWLVVGDGRMTPWVADEIARRGLDETVVLLGRYPVERMPGFFKHADALLVSLKDEPIFAMTIPGKVQSYLAAGIPVIAMLNGEGARVIEQAAAGLTCNAGDACGLADSVLRLSRTPAEERKAMGARGAKASAEQFDRDTLMNQLVRALERQRPGRRAGNATGLGVKESDPETREKAS
jgi:glycosyltransferase involved in cell wall biosynthesis